MRGTDLESVGVISKTEPVLVYFGSDLKSGKNPRLVPVTKVSRGQNIEYKYEPASRGLSQKNLKCRLKPWLTKFNPWLTGLSHGLNDLSHGLQHLSTGLPRLRRLTGLNFVSIKQVQCLNL